MKCFFAVAFDYTLPRLGNDEYEPPSTISRIGIVPVAGVPTNVILIETDDVTMAALKANPDYLYVGDAVEVSDGREG